MKINNQKFEAFQTEIRQGFADVKGEIAQVRDELHQVRDELHGEIVQTRDSLRQEIHDESRITRDFVRQEISASEHRVRAYVDGRTAEVIDSVAQLVGDNVLPQIDELDGRVTRHDQRLTRLEVKAV